MAETSNVEQKVEEVKKDQHIEKIKIWQEPSSELMGKLFPNLVNEGKIGVRHKALTITDYGRDLLRTLGDEVGEKLSYTEQSLFGMESAQLGLMSCLKSLVESNSDETIELSVVDVMNRWVREIQGKDENEIKKIDVKQIDAAVKKMVEKVKRGLYNEDGTITPDTRVIYLEEGRKAWPARRAELEANEAQKIASNNLLQRGEMADSLSVETQQNKMAMDQQLAGKVVESPAITVMQETKLEQPKKMWEHMLVGEAEVDQAINEGKRIVFSGGACNVIDAEGNLVRNTKRDRINAELDKRKIVFFDPQIATNTHGREYDFDKDGMSERKASVASQDDLFLIDPDTFGGVTHLEVFRDARNQGAKQVVWIDGANNDRSVAFAPKGLDNPSAVERHVKEVKKNADSMRKNFINMVREDGMEKTPNNQKGNVTIIFDEEGKSGQESFDQINKEGMHAVAIGSDKMNCAAILEAYAKAMTGEPVAIYFKGNRDAKGKPVMDMPELTPENTQQFLEAYIREGNEMRKVLKEKLLDKPATKIVANEEDALKGILENYNLQVEGNNFEPQDIRKSVAEAVG
jgi:hypothetical protein